MDEIVIRSMLKWPDVPSVYGWLTLDRRGNWLIKTVAGRFDRITNPAVIEFIGRNYAPDEHGRWFFQNGPQRVFVALDYTPCVYRLDDSAGGLVSHTGAIPRRVGAAYVDDAGMLLLDTELGIGVLLDRDIEPLLRHLTGAHGDDADTLLEVVEQGTEAGCRLFGRELRIAPIRAADIPGRFGFVARPQPAPGEPEC